MLLQRFLDAYAWIQQSSDILLESAHQEDEASPINGCKAIMVLSTRRLLRRILQLKVPCPLRWTGLL